MHGVPTHESEHADLNVLRTHSTTPNDGGITAAMASSDDKSDALASNKDPVKRTQAQNGTDTQRSVSPNQVLRRATTTPLSPVSTSLNSSPIVSRETSPIRPSAKQPTPNSRLSRSRKSSQDFSPHRASNASTTSIPAVPSAAAVQRALSATRSPPLPSPASQDSSGDAQRPPRQSRGSSGSGVPAGLAPLRLKSPPPPSSNPRTPSWSPRKAEYPPLTPAIIVNSATPNSATSFDREEEENMLRTGIRTPVRGNSAGSTLETVEESSLPATTSIGMNVSQNINKGGDRPSTIDETLLEDAAVKAIRAITESGNESSGSKNGETPKQQVSISSTRPTINPRKSLSQLNSSKTKIASEPSIQNMTVETETVSSIPQVAVGGGTVERGPGRSEAASSVRLKPSSETIRPKKEKKKVVRKAPSITSGTASSKADIFEAKVASAVDEANSSDSEETFVYESNPPEPPPNRPNRYHSRTPSATSTASQANHYEGRFRQDSLHSVAGKKSMKFASNSHHLNGLHGEGENGHGSGSGSGRASGGHISHHHHIGRYGRGAAHPSIFDNESPFPNASKSLRTPASNGSRNSPRPLTPRSARLLNNGKSTTPIPYDLEGEGADDERTPLIASVRAGRTRNSRRPPTRPDLYNTQSPMGTWRRIAGCLFLGGLVGLLIAAVVVALILCSEPLYDVHIKSLDNVLASEQEIMLDLHVHAINPNLVAIQVSDLDINIFAKSKYVGTSAWWRDRQGYPQPGRNSVDDGPSYRTTGGVDEGNDPIDDPDADAHTMLLGQVLDFDSPLIFESSPIRHEASSSTGEVRLAKPGNTTEVGGTDRWAKVLQHPFELIVKGVIHYSLPISSRVRSVNIVGSVTIRPSGPDLGHIGDGEVKANHVTTAGSPEPERTRTRLIQFTA